MPIVIKLEKNTDGDEDMVFEDGAIMMSEDGEATAVQMKERLLLDRGELIEQVDEATLGDNVNPLVNTSADPIAGTDWFGTILRNEIQKSAKELEIKRVIFSTPGVKSITYWSWSVENRTLNLDFKVATIYGDLEVGETIQL